MPRLSFTEHPASVGETYGEHMVSAWGFGARMALGACACFVHGTLPFLCVTTGSRTIREGSQPSQLLLQRADIAMTQCDIMR